MNISPEKQLAAIENAMDGIALLDQHGVYYYMNISHASLFGYDAPEELIGKTWKAVYEDEYAGKIEKEIFPKLAEKGNWVGETIGISKSGKPVLQHVSLTKLPDGGLICVCRDNSNSINANRLKYLMSNLAKGILVEDENHSIILVNSQFCALFGIDKTPEEMMGTNCLEALQNSLSLFDEPDVVMSEIINMVGKQEPVIGKEVFLKSGLILERDYIPIIIENTFKGQLWSYTDVTQNRQLQGSLIKAKNHAIASEKAKSVFLSNMSHEIRTPMNAIIGLAEQLSLTQLNDKQAYFVKAMAESANGLLGIINDILDLSKVEAGKLHLDNGPLNIHSICKSVENILSPKAEEKNVSLAFMIDPNISDHLIGDEIRMRQVFMNILGNAIKFTDAGSIVLKLSLSTDNGKEQRVKIECTDTGIGITAEGLSHVFQEFYQENSIGASGREGSGLGLVITKSLVRLMGGDIWINSEFGKGTTVHLEIPFQQSTENTKASDLSAFEECTLLKNRKVLIVEDNKINRLLFSIMLTNLEMKVVEACNGLEAISHLEKDADFDLILMDIQMPVMDGKTALSMIRSKFGAAIPVIALTASAFKSEVLQMMELGFVDCITKPVDQKNLKSRLCDFFKTTASGNKIYSRIFDKVRSNIAEMVGFDEEQTTRMINYLVEELEYAILEWTNALSDADWVRAKKALHREKVMLQSIGLTEFDQLILEIEGDRGFYSNDEFAIRFKQLLELFENLIARFRPAFETSPV